MTSRKTRHSCFASDSSPSSKASACRVSQSSRQGSHRSVRAERDAQEDQGWTTRQRNDLQALTSLVLTQDASLDLTDLLEYYRRRPVNLIGRFGPSSVWTLTRYEPLHAIRHKQPELNSHQVKFLDLLQNHLGKYGSIEVGDLYEPPFTLIHSDGLDGVFDEPLVEELLTVIGSFTHKDNTGQRTRPQEMDRIT